MLRDKRKVYIFVSVSRNDLSLCAACGADSSDCLGSRSGRVEQADVSVVSGAGRVSSDDTGAKERDADANISF